MNVLIFGAGAVGSVFGGFLCRDGHSVTLIGRKPHMDAVAADGLHITGIWGEHHVPNLLPLTAVDDRPDRIQFDLILVTVKSFDTVEAGRTVAPLVGPATTVLSLQNGIGNVETLAKSIDPGRVFGGRVIFGVDLLEPGRVKVTVYAEEVRVGHPSGAGTETAKTIADAFSHAGIPTLATDEIHRYLWGKLLYNAALNPLGAIFEKTYGELAAEDTTRVVMDRIIDEIFSVAAVERVGLFWKNPNEFRKLFYGKLVPATADHYPSMLRDLQHGRRTEIDAFNGAVVHLADKHYLSVPVNRSITERIRYLEINTVEKEC